MGAGSSVADERKSLVREHLEKKKEKRASTQDLFSDFSSSPSNPVTPATQLQARTQSSPVPQAPSSSTSGTSGGSRGASIGSSAASSPSALPTRASKAAKQQQMAEVDALIISEATAMATAGRDRGRGEGKGESESLYQSGSAGQQHQSPTAQHAALTAQASAHWHRLLLHAREQRNLEQEQLAQVTSHGVRQIVYNADKRQYERVESASASGGVDDGAFFERNVDSKEGAGGGGGRDGDDDEIIYTNDSVDDGDADADDYGAYMHAGPQGRGSERGDGVAVAFEEDSLRDALERILYHDEDGEALPVAEERGLGGGVHGDSSGGGGGGGSSASPLAALHRGNSTHRPRREGPDASKHQRRFNFPKETSSDLASLAVGGASSKVGSGVGYSGSSYGPDYDYADAYAGGEEERGLASEKETLKVAGGLGALPPLEVVLTSRTATSLTLSWDSTPLIQDILSGLRHEINGKVLIEERPSVTYEVQVRPHQAVGEDAGGDEENNELEWALAVPRTGERYGTVTHLACNTQYVLRARRLGLGPEGREWGGACVIRTGPGVPSCPQNVSPSEVTSSSIMVTWGLPERDNGLPLFEYVVRMKSWKDGFFTEVYRGRERLFVATALQPNIVHVVEIYGVNKAGMGACSERVAVRTLKPGCADMTPWIEQVDASTDKLFYVHLKSRATAATLPVGGLLDRVKSFKAKRAYLRKVLARRGIDACRACNLEATTCHVEVPRRDMLLPSLQALRWCPEEHLLGGPVRIKWEGEPGLDAGGLSKDWYCALARKITDGTAGLLQPGDTGTSIDLRADAIHGFEARWLFRIIGCFFAKALVDEQPLGVQFNRILLAHFLGRSPGLDDVAHADPPMHRGLAWVQENDVTDADLTFSASYDLFGEAKEVRLTAAGPTEVITSRTAAATSSDSTASAGGGGDVDAVTEGNKDVYVERMVSWLVLHRFEPSLSYMLEGFHSIVPAVHLQHFKAEELQTLLGGQPSIELADVQAPAQYMGGYSSESSQCVWLWAWLGEADQELLGRVLAFVTGCATLPVDGLNPPFTVTLSMEGAEDLGQHDGEGEYALGVLPRAHTCFNQLVLPPYRSAEVQARKLMLALDHGAEGFFLT